MVFTLSYYLFRRLKGGARGVRGVFERVARGRNSSLRVSAFLIPVGTARIEPTNGEPLRERFLRREPSREIPELGASDRNGDYASGKVGAARAHSKFFRVRELRYFLFLPRFDNDSLVLTSPGAVLRSFRHGIFPNPQGYLAGAGLRRSSE